MRKSISDSILGTINDLNECGVIDKVTYKNIKDMCLPDIQDYSAEDISNMRKKYNMSQAAFAAVLNVSVSTVQKWEKGLKQPSGASKKLLDILEKKGLEVLVS